MQKLIYMLNQNSTNGKDGLSLMNVIHGFKLKAIQYVRRLLFVNRIVHRIPKQWWLFTQNVTSRDESLHSKENELVVACTDSLVVRASERNFNGFAFNKLVQKCFYDEN